ncbi:MAG: spermidine/putrescine ABC transporter substrate-binding protein [Chloroflexaceae bacterium]|nr:spermidine/putrescine ABC transporter substrate-binding protein [Chloroflexaceae bacterium]
MTLKEVQALKNWLLVTLLITLLAACGGTRPPGPPHGETEEEAPAETTGEQAATGDSLAVDPALLSDELYFFNWSDYIDPQILEDFEAEYGVRVVQDLYDSNEAMLPKIRAGNSGYDIVVPSDYAVEVMILEGLLAPLDKVLLPNMQYLNEDLLNMYYDPENTYSVPYFWGTTGIAYNSKFFETPPTTLAAIFEPENLEAIDGRFTVLDDPRETPATALLYLGEDINTTNEDVLQQAEALLTQQKPYVSAYDSANQGLKLATEEIMLAHTYSGSAGQAIVGIDDEPANPNLVYIIPEEGGVIWQDNLAIVADSPNKYTAHVFINYLMRPDVAARNTDYVLYLTPNTAVRDLLAEATIAVFEAGVEPTEEQMQRLQWIERNEQTDTLYTDLWTRVISQ